MRVQAAVRDELTRSMTEFRAIGACGIVMDVRTGEVIAMVSLPDFDANKAGEAPAEEDLTGQPYERETFGDWSLRCVRAAEGPDPCQLYQLLLDAEGNAVAEISMFPLPEGGEAVAGATIVAPLETLLTEELTLSVDGAAARVYPFTFCTAAGCVARVGFTAEEVQQFRNGVAAEA